MDARHGPRVTGEMGDDETLTGVPGTMPMSAPDIDETDQAAVLETLRSGVLSLGPGTELFESACADLAGTTHGVAVSSGTAGLHLIVRALGIGQGHEVLVPSFTFAASVNALLFEGAQPMFVDVDPDTYNLAPADVDAKVTDRTKGVMVVDIFGHPAEWNDLEEIASRHDLRLIDDSCEAIGATYRGRPVGGFGAAGCFAFYPNKQMTTGEGGMIVTDDDELASRCRSLRNQGRGEMSLWLQHERLGFNYRIDEMSAALGASQIARLPTFLSKRAAVAQRYTEMLAPYGWIRPPLVRSHVEPSWFVYVITLADGIDRDVVMSRMSSAGVPTRAYFSPIHLQPYIRERFGDLRGTLPVTESIADRTLALPFHNNLLEDQAELVVRTLVDAVGAR
jgi:perosamine synthetase